MMHGRWRNTLHMEAHYLFGWRLATTGIKARASTVHMQQKRNTQSLFMRKRLNQLSLQMLDSAPAIHLRCAQMRAHDAHISQHSAQIPVQMSTVGMEMAQEWSCLLRQLRTSRKLSISGRFRKQMLLSVFSRALSSAMVGM
jgi:hypothetical protein